MFKGCKITSWQLAKFFSLLEVMNDNIGTRHTYLQLCLEYFYWNSAKLLR